MVYDLNGSFSTGRFAFWVSIWVTARKFGGDAFGEILNLDSHAVAERTARYKRRHDRRFAFDLFFRFSKEHFDQIAASDPRAEFFKYISSLCIVPGGRGGGHDKRIVEVFFGSRPFDSYTDVSFDNGHVTRKTWSMSETGASLQYYRQHDDTVVVFLYPAKTSKDGGTEARDESNLSEKSTMPAGTIIVDVIREPRVLTGRPRLEAHWRCFMAMMETSSIDGAPTIRDHLRMYWLRFTKYEIVDGRVGRTRLWKFLGLGVSFFFTVGLAGWIFELADILTKK